MSWCDLRVMANTARAGYLQTKMGVVTGWGGASRLRSLLGPSAALSLLTSPRILPPECLSRGLITQHPIMRISQP
ncbi:hypothetical protein BCR33DRAFT_491256 [Rhizoclosmatium globosum]|uniref:Uncharacterized protein n=1 Tax=Rhizoclosmatium globosum TaxID=329046 RepID=A0A1Y2BPA4_9FUNG|nr:hypothetical protein BCR33DRAFT_491256 [Rhizoclosmatium globosum]|eukprot:ORY35985.1 hypothetical protein BCR33DRAFT_491256 [Rhizoclosmatium globosum]